MGVFHFTEAGRKGKRLAIYIGVGYPIEDTAVIEQAERKVKSTLHFGKW